jgi:hypothetical protein
VQASVVAGLVPAIHVFGGAKRDVNARAKRGHDDRGAFADDGLSG